MDSEWTTLIRQYWNTNWLRDEADAASAANELRLFFTGHPPDNAELCTVIRWMAGPAGKQEKTPSLKELIRAICICRKAKRQEDYGYLPGDQGPGARLGRIKAAMLKADNHYDRWDILCEGIKMPDEGDGLCAWAARTWKDWTASLPAVKASVKLVMEPVARAMDVSGDDGLEEWYQR